MHLEYGARDDLPKLAWLALCDRAEARVKVHHGSAVETRQTFFIEGVWDGPFAAGDFAATDCVFGSGGVVSDDGVVFVSSTATTDYLFYRDTGPTVVIANSLPLLLACLGDRLDPHFLGYGPINDSIAAGIKAYVPQIPTENGSVRRLIHLNLEVTRSAVREVEKPLPPTFETFEEFRAYLTSKVGRTLTNARDVARAQPMAVLTTQSKGYDTTAVNAIAARFRIDRAFTVSKGKGVGYAADRDRDHQTDDDGTEICQVLGIPCTQLDRRAFETRYKFECELYSTVDENMDANFLELFDHVTQVSVLLTGALGEIWYGPAGWAYNSKRPVSGDLIRFDLANNALAEVRLIVGFVQVAPVYIGARRRHDLIRITESSSMDPWRLGRLYDRPIARRIAEEAGVPRSLFGQTKMASIVSFLPPHVPWNHALRQEYFDFLSAHRLLPRWKHRLFPAVHYFNWMLRVSHRTRFRVLYLAQRLISKLIGREYKFPLLWSRLNGSIFCFCVNRRIPEFQRLWPKS